MRQIILPFLFYTLFFVSPNLFGQNINYGIQFGSGVSQLQIPALKGIPLISNQPIFSYQINSFVQYQVNDHFAFQLEPGYIRKGGELGILPEWTDIHTSLKLDYIHIPLIAQFYPKQNIALSIGPEFSYLLGHNYDFMEIVLDPIPQKFNVGLNAGITYYPSDTFSIGLRFNQVFTPLLEIPTADYLPLFQKNVAVTQRNFALTLGIAL